MSLLLDLGLHRTSCAGSFGMHADISVTMQIYAYASLDERRRAMDAA